MMLSGQYTVQALQLLVITISCLMLLKLVLLAIPSADTPEPSRTCRGSPMRRRCRRPVTVRLVMRVEIVVLVLAR